jgi:hypothetical protein
MLLDMEMTITEKVTLKKLKMALILNVVAS